MKRTIICCALLLIGCSSSSIDKERRTGWDSGASKEDAYQQERMEETSENVQNQLPSVRPATETNQPF